MLSFPRSPSAPDCPHSLKSDSPAPCPPSGTALCSPWSSACRRSLHSGGTSGLQAAQLALKDAQEQVALDASAAYIELDTVNRELEAAHEQEQDAAAWSPSSSSAPKPASIPLSALLQAQLTAAQLKLKRLHLETRAATLAKQLPHSPVCRWAPSRPITPAFPRFPRSPPTKRPRQLPGIDSAQATARIQSNRGQGRRRALVAAPRSRLRRPIQPQHHAAEQHQHLLAQPLHRRTIQHRLLRSPFPSSISASAPRPESPPPKRCAPS